jgi:hypothetical protein
MVNTTMVVEKVKMVMVIKAAPTMLRMILLISKLVKNTFGMIPPSQGRTSMS